MDIAIAGNQTRLTGELLLYFRYSDPFRYYPVAIRYSVVANLA